jgi:hypothetical protein
MGLGEDFFFEQILLDFKIDEKKFFLDYITQYKNQLCFLNKN